MAELARGFSRENLQMCPAGLIEESALQGIEVDSNVDRMKSPPFSGGAEEQPGPLLDALRIVSYRRGLHQRRMLAEIKAKPGV